MEDLDAEDDGYSDEDLDALPAHAFHDLQENAIRSTQNPVSEAHLPTLDQLRGARTFDAARFARAPVNGAPNTSAGRHAPAQPSSDYGDFDDEMLDGEIIDAASQPALAARFENKAMEKKPGESTQREQWRQQRYSCPLPSENTTKNRQIDEQPTGADEANDTGFTTQTQKIDWEKEALGRASSVDGQNYHGPARGSIDIEALQAQVQKLLREREVLQQGIQDANDTAFAKAGEIAIVRANTSKIEKDYENRTKSLQKLHADEAARQKLEIEKARLDLQKITTEKVFLENDLAEGTKQIRNLQRAIKKGAEKVTGKENQPATPKKTKYLPLRDGFDDDEVQPMSPSKLALRSKATTPKGGSKRKRKAPEDSPIKPLELSKPKQVEPAGNADRRKTDAEAEPAVTDEGPKRPDKRFQLTQKLLNHRYAPDELRTFERLTGFAYPSQPDKPLSTILLDELSTLTYNPDTERFPSALALIIISIWSRCMQETYHQPVHLLVALVKVILEMNPIKTAPDLINDLMSLVQSTADIILVPRCQKKPPRKDRAEINSTDCLEIMLLMAYDCICDDEEIIRFWRTMRFDFIMMLLNFINPITEIHIMLSLLRTSILDHSFAMIVPPNNGQQDASEAHILDNLSHLLINNPRPQPGDPPPDAIALCTLRLEVLGLIDAMCQSAYSAEILAKHRLVIGCLVRVMNDELARVYDYQTGHELRVELVNQSTRLLYHLTNRFPHLVDMQTKLSVVPGGEKKYLIALTRLAFSEGGFYEQGIEDDVVDVAHQMLEARVSPEEAEGLVEAFSSAPVSRK